MYVRAIYKMFAEKSFSTALRHMGTATYSLWYLPNITETFDLMSIANIERRYLYPAQTLVNDGMGEDEYETSEDTGAIDGGPKDERETREHDPAVLFLLKTREERSNAGGSGGNCSGLSRYLERCHGEPDYRLEHVAVPRTPT